MPTSAESTNRYTTLKKLANHIGALWYFIHDYNAQQRAKLCTTTIA
jgi:hypothetical protein